MITVYPPTYNMQVVTTLTTGAWMLPGRRRIELTRLLSGMIWVSGRWDTGDQAIYNRAC
jgi:hypothetical protein